jgi:starch phosphorylase
MAYRQRSANQGKIAAQVVNWNRELEQKWDAIRFGEVKIESAGELNIFELHIYLDSLDPDAVKVELYAEGINGNNAELIEMKRAQQLLGAGNGFAYRAEVSASRLASDYTARLIPYREGVIIPLEETHILWQR